MSPAGQDDGGRLNFGAQPFGALKVPDELLIRFEKETFGNISLFSFDVLVKDFLRVC